VSVRKVLAFDFVSTRGLLERWRGKDVSVSILDADEEPVASFTGTLAGVRCAAAGIASYRCGDVGFAIDERAFGRGEWARDHNQEALIVHNGGTTDGSMVARVIRVDHPAAPRDPGR
jgi:hypothetical protein